MFARLSATQRQTTANAGSEGHYFDQEGMDLIRAFLLFLVEATARELATADINERSMRALRELCTRDHERLLDLMGWMQHQRHIAHGVVRSEEHTSELQSLMRTSYAVFCLKKKTPN